jgi:hypothetical protein
MGLISEFIFGRQIKIQDDKLGELTAKVKSDNPSINYTWTGEHKLAGQIKPTVFILEGNNLGPYGEQLKAVHRIVDTLDNIIAQVDKELKGRPNIKQRFKGNWTKEFYLAAVTPYDPDVKGEGKQFEINFEPIKEDDTNYVGLLWNNDRLTEIEAK